MFKELLGSIGTKNYRYDEFNDKLMNSTNGIEVTLDKYSFTPDHNDILDRNEQILIQTGFLDRNINEAFECLAEIIATPNFDEQDNLSDLVRMQSVEKASNMGNKGLEYGRSYCNGGLKAYAKSFEDLGSDIFFCQYAQEILQNTNSRPILMDAIINMTEIASYLFREDNIEFAIHGNKAKFNLIKLKLEMLVNQIKNENSRFSEEHSNILRIESEFSQPKYHLNYFKTPLAVNNCLEGMLGPTYANEKDYAAGLVLSELMTFSFLMPLIREKGGAYGAGCALNESGLINFYSYRDPQLDRTYDNFEKAVQNVIDGQFGEQQIQESKLLAFQKLDKVLDPSYKGLIEFSRGYKDDQRLRVRLHALDCQKTDLQQFATKYMMAAIEGGKTSRVVFGSQTADPGELAADG